MVSNHCSGTYPIYYSKILCFINIHYYICGLYVKWVAPATPVNESVLMNHLTRWDNTIDISEWTISFVICLSSFYILIVSKYRQSPFLCSSFTFHSILIWYILPFFYYLKIDNFLSGSFFCKKIQLKSIKQIENMKSMLVNGLYEIIPSGVFCSRACKDSFLISYSIHIWLIWKNVT